MSWRDVIRKKIRSRVEVPASIRGLGEAIGRALDSYPNPSAAMSSEHADRLREFIRDDLPDCFWVDPYSLDVRDVGPDEDTVECRQCDGTGDGFEGSPCGVCNGDGYIPFESDGDYYRWSKKAIVRAVFGNTIADKFYRELDQ